MAKKHHKKKFNILIPLLIVLLLITGAAAGFAYYLYKEGNKTTPYYLGNDEPLVPALDKDGNETFFTRGNTVNIKNRTEKIDDVEYRIFTINDKNYFILDKYLKNSIEECVEEKELFITRNFTATYTPNTYEISRFIKNGTVVNITGFNKLKEDGTIDYYEIDNNCYVPSKYLAKEYIDNSLYSSIYADTDFYEGGSPTDIKYYHKENIFFVNNIMPETVKALYINAEAVPQTDKYIEIAKQCGINSFVVDIKDCYLDTQMAYDSEVMKEYAPSTSNIVNTVETYKKATKAIKDNGFYLIGRITAFKDDSFAVDNPDEAILEADGSLYYYGPVAWPSIYSRKMWEYDLALANEAIDLFEFDEIQFDYCRFPEHVDESTDTHNKYNETPSQCITEFLRYATEQLHKKDVYISADVFGEISGWTSDEYSAFVTNYGQFWCAISNVVDAISSMPYPDHFSAYAYGIPEPWEEPGELMYHWGRATKFAQDKTYDPAKCRTWIQAQYSDEYDVNYTSELVKAQIDGLSEAGVNDGYLTWNAASSLSAYNSYIDAFE